jgi:four helix bundle protein
MTKYDLRDRSFRFSVKLVRFLNGLGLNRLAGPLFNQVLRSGTSIGANIEESDSSPSRKDFRHKLIISKKEAAETVYWFKILIEANIITEQANIATAKEILDEADQLLKILGSITHKL